MIETVEEPTPVAVEKAPTKDKVQPTSEQLMIAQIINDNSGSDDKAQSRKIRQVCKNQISDQIW